MSAFTVTQSWLLLIGAIVLAVFVARLPLLIKDYSHKRSRKKQLTPPVWFPADKYISRDGHLFFIGGKTPEQ
ncbi:hypothetical protein AH553_25005 [Salmonella enterica subsp. diarizonae]|nr:hypothetical protein [Salmonella enterica subsp. enterica serovar Newport]EDM1758350.1 hypothetical protein [Salmonella enterica subsp. diarizonae]